MNLNRRIWVTFQRKGIHLYPQAASESSLQDVSYLGYPHRHLFKFKVTIEVFHDDREIEFHQFLNWLESLYDEGVLELNHRSCEMIAQELLNKVLEQYVDNRRTRSVEVEVSEDGECGSIVSWA